MSLLGRQSVSDVYSNIFAYDILYRSGEEQRMDYTDFERSASAYAVMLNEIGFENVLGGHLGLLRVDSFFLKSNFLSAIPKENFSLMLMDQVLDDKDMLPKVASLKAEGFNFGVNDFVGDDVSMTKLAPWLEMIDIVKLDVLNTERMRADGMVKNLKSKQKKVIASKVENYALFEHFKKSGADYFEGFFYERPKTIGQSSFDVVLEEVLPVWNLLQSDADTRKIVAEIEQHHTLSLKLVQMINSAFYEFTNHISSIGQIVTLLGRKQLSNWLLLFLITQKSSDGRMNNPLILMIVSRTEVMVRLLKLARPDASAEEASKAYLVGMLSLAHLLFGVDHRALLHRLNVSDDIEEAMFEANGFYGQLLTMTRYLENMDLEKINAYAEKFRIEDEAMKLLIADVMKKVNAFEAMM